MLQLWLQPFAATSNTTPLRVVLLAGQSNAEGQALTYRTDGSPGTLDHVLQTNAAAAVTFGAWTPMSRDASGRPAWPSRDDVYVYFDSEWGLQYGQLTAGFGAYNDLLHFGLEMEVGRLLGDHYSDPLLIVKVAYGDKSLKVDFRPPSAGGDASPGAYYTRLIDNYRAALARIGTAFPALTPSLEGVIWWQGFNDFCCGTRALWFSNFCACARVQRCPGFSAMCALHAPVRTNR